MLTGTLLLRAKNFSTRFFRIFLKRLGFGRITHIYISLDSRAQRRNAHESAFNVHAQVFDNQLFKRFTH